MARGGKRSTSFTPETAPKGNKGAKWRKTKIKEAIGIENWNQLPGWVEGEGLQKAIEELKKLKGKDYIYAFDTLMEYVKPKLQRTTLVGEKDNPVPIDLTAGLTFEELYLLKYGKKPE